MGDRSKIEWTDATWNPVTGCSKVSAGCAHCYAERQFPRVYRDREFGDVRCHEDRLDQPLRWKRPRKVFVCSMGDLFHEAVPNFFLDVVFLAMAGSYRHTFQVLTKRPERMRAYLSSHETAGRLITTATTCGADVHAKDSGDGLPGIRFPNIWLGVSVENQAAADERIPILLSTPAAVRFVSCEPLLGPVKLPGMGWFRGLDWVIAGGESGPRARPMHPDWARSLRDQCQEAGVPFLFKQWGEWAPNCLCDTKRAHRTTPRPEPGHMGCMFRCGKKAAGRQLDGRTWDEYPARDGGEK